MQAKVSWVGQMRFVGSADTGHGVIMDSKMSDSPQIGSSPMEMVLMALGGCSSIDIVDILRKMRQELTSLEVQIKAERAPEPPRVFTKASLEFVASGEGLTDASLKRAVDLSMEKYCSVAAMLQKSGTKIDYRFSVKTQGSAGEAGDAPPPSAPEALKPHEERPHPSHELPNPGGPGPMPRGKQS